MLMMTMMLKAVVTIVTPVTFPRPLFSQGIISVLACRIFQRSQLNKAGYKRIKRAAWVFECLSTKHSAAMLSLSISVVLDMASSVVMGSEGRDPCICRVGAMVYSSTPDCQLGGGSLGRQHAMNALFTGSLPGF